MFAIFLFVSFQLASVACFPAEQVTLAVPAIVSLVCCSSSDDSASVHLASRTDLHPAVLYSTLVDLTSLHPIDLRGKPHSCSSANPCSLCCARSRLVILFVWLLHSVVYVHHECLTPCAVVRCLRLWQVCTTT
jgi:hypothetical protein